jgi:hypothetical protein
MRGKSEYGSNNVITPNIHRQIQFMQKKLKKKKTKFHGLSPRANYTDRATAACRLSDCQLLRIEGAMWSV